MIDQSLVDLESLEIDPEAIELNDRGRIYLPALLVRIGLFGRIEDAREAVWKRA